MNDTVREILTTEREAHLASARQHREKLATHQAQVDAARRAAERDENRAARITEELVGAGGIPFAHHHGLQAAPSDGDDSWSQEARLVFDRVLAGQGYRLAPGAEVTCQLTVGFGRTHRGTPAEVTVTALVVPA